MKFNELRREDTSLTTRYYCQCCNSLGEWQARGILTGRVVEQVHLCPTCVGELKGKKVPEEVRKDCCETPSWRCPILRRTGNSAVRQPPWFCAAFNSYLRQAGSRILQVVGCGVTLVYLNSREAE